jgi:DNA-binding transcriptional ArsR family regulator
MRGKASAAAVKPDHAVTVDLPPAALELVAARFRALGEPLRLRILQVLARGESGVSALARIVGSTQPNISKHLRVLQEVGLVERRPQGSVVNYSIADTTVLELCDLVCAGVRERLEAQVGAMQAKAFTGRRLD